MAREHPAATKAAPQSREKLQAVLERPAERLGKAALGAEVGVLLCDVGDAASLAAVARQTRLVLNCVGPWRYFQRVWRGSKYKSWKLGHDDVFEIGGT